MGNSLMIVLCANRESAMIVYVCRCTFVCQQTFVDIKISKHHANDQFRIGFKKVSLNQLLSNATGLDALGHNLVSDRGHQHLQSNEIHSERIQCSLPALTLDSDTLKQLRNALPSCRIYR